MHLKRLAAPKSWQIKRKGINFIQRPSSSGHPMHLSMPLVLILKSLELGKTKKEIKTILNNNQVLVDGRRIKKADFGVGLMDTIALPNLNKFYRVMLNHKGKIFVIPIDAKEVMLKLCKIKGKKFVKGRLQLNLNDGRSILVKETEYKIGDSLLIELPNQEIKKKIKLEKELLVYLIGGKHVGELGKIEDIKINKIFVKSNGKRFETLKKYALAVGKDKPVIKLVEV